MHDNLDNSNKRRSRRRLGVLLASAVGALVIVAVAAAANSASFPDRPEDVTLAPDINRLDVSNDDGGTITINLAFPPGRTIGLPGDEVGVALDLDQNPDTGSVYYGTEALVMFQGNTLRFGRAAGNGFSPAPPPPSMHGAIGNGVVTFSVNASDLGLTPAVGFNIVALSDNSVVGEMDAAPESAHSTTSKCSEHRRRRWGPIPGLRSIAHSRRAACTGRPFASVTGLPTAAA